MSVVRFASFAATSLAIAAHVAQVRAAGMGGDESVDELVAAMRAELAAEYDAKLEAAVAGIAQRYQSKLTEATSGRRILADAAEFNGLAIKRDSAGVVLGVNGDVRLLRTGADELSIVANTNIEGAVSISGKLTVQANTTVDGAVSISGALTVQADTTVDGSVSITDNLVVQDRNVLGELDDIASCSYASDATARCADPTSTYKMSECCDGGG